MNLPNKLSLARICMIPLFVLLYFLPFSVCAVLAVVVFVLAAFTDFLDGYIARKYNLVTDLGKLLDPIADKILVCAALFCVVATNPMQFVPSYLQGIKFFSGDFGQIFLCVSATLILARELLISAVRQIAAAKNVVVQANVYGKIKTILQVVALPFIILLSIQGKSDFVAYDWHVYLFDSVWTIGFVVFLGAIVMTIVSGVIYLVQNAKVFESK